MVAIPAVRTRKILVGWVVLILLGALAAEGLSMLLARHGRRLREGDYRTYLGYAADFVKKNDFPHALAEVEEAKRRAHDASAPYVIAGDIHYELKQWEKAIAEYNQALERKNQEAGPRLNKVWALIELKRYDEAVAFGSKAESEGFRSPAMARFIAEACFRAGKQADAIPHYEEALRGYPNDLYLLEHLRQCFTRTGQAARVKEMSERIADAEASMKRVTVSGS